MKNYLSTTNAAKIRSVSDRELDPKSDAGVPLLLHATGDVCWPLTDWILHSYNTAKLATSTVRTYADQIVLFLHYLDREAKHLQDASDHTLEEFREHLLHDGINREHDQINRIIKRVLWAYIFLQDYGYFGDRRVIGARKEHPDAAIRYQVEIKPYRTKAGQRGERSVITHHSLLEPGISKERYPIPSNVIDALWDAVDKASDSPFIQERDKVMLLLFESVGPRINELVLLTIEQVEAAQKSGTLTWKQSKSGRDREAPLPTETLNRLLSFIDRHRASVIKAAVASGVIKQDHGFVFIGRHGKPWGRKSAINEFAKLREVGGITDPAHSHLFRHRRDTQQAASLYEESEHPLEPSTFAARLESRTGKTIGATERYVDFEFDEAEALQRSEQEVTAQIERAIQARVLRDLATAAERSSEVKDLQSIFNEILLILRRKEAAKAGISEGADNG